MNTWRKFPGHYPCDCVRVLWPTCMLFSSMASYYEVLLGTQEQWMVTTHIGFEVPRTPLTNNLRGGIPYLPLSFWFGSQCHLRGEHYCWGLVSLTCESYWVLYNFVFSHLAKIPWLFLIVSLLILMRVSVFEAHYDLTFAIVKMTFFSNCVHRKSLVWSHGLRGQYNFNWLPIVSTDFGTDAFDAFSWNTAALHLHGWNHGERICTFYKYFFLNVWIIIFLFSPLHYIY